MTVTMRATADPRPALMTLHDTPAGRNPALVYLASPGSPAAKRTIRKALQGLTPGSHPQHLAW